MNELVEQYINDNEWSKTNANHNRSASGLKTHIADNVLRDYALSQFGEYGTLHQRGIIYLHNLDGGPYSIYCSGHSLETLLMKGLVNPIGVSSKPARHLDSVLDHIVNATYMFTQEFMGAQAWRDIDVLLAPYVYEDGLNYEGVKQAVQRMIWNISYPLRSGFQTPFVNFTFGLRPSKHYDDKPVIMPGGELNYNLTYNDLQGEIDMINEAFLNVMIEGAGGKPFSFPLPTYNVTKDFKWDSDIANLIFELAAKWGTPYFSNYSSTDFSEEDLWSFCCRLKIDMKEVHRVSGGIWDFGSDTGSIAVATINMAQLGYLTKGDEGAFYNRLDALLDKARDYLLLKKKYALKGIELGLYPMIQSYIGKKIGATYFLTIGINGLNECSLNFSGKDIVQNVNWCEKVLQHINERIRNIQQETGQLFNFEATPNEGASYTLAKLDRARFPCIVTGGTDEAPFYTGSSLIPHGYEIDLVSALRHQDKLQKYYTGGSVFHIDVGEAYSSPGGVKDLIKGVCTKTTLPYVTWSPSYCLCPVHGKTSGKNQCCEKGEVFSRIVGFYRPTSRWNKGKLEEFKGKVFMNLATGEVVDPSTIKGLTRAKELKIA